MTSLSILNRLDAAYRTNTIVDLQERQAYVERVRDHFRRAARVGVDEEELRRLYPLPPIIDIPPPPPRVQAPRPERVNLPRPDRFRRPRPPAQPRPDLPPYVPLARRPFTEDLVNGVDVVNGRHTIGPTIACPHCGARVWVQERSAGSKTKPLFSICCQQGRVSLPEIEPDPILLEMFNDQTPAGKDFRKNIRKYNSALSFTSMGVTVDKDLANDREGVYTYRIQGAVVHEMGRLQAVEGQKPKFAQIFFYGPEEQAVRRNEIFGGALDEDRLAELQALLEEKNRFCQVYKNIREREADAPPGDAHKIVLNASREPKGRKERQYDLPSAEEIAVLLPGDGTATEPRDIIIQGRDGYFQRINENHPTYDSMQYTLIQPQGEDGWTYNTYIFDAKEGCTPCIPTRWRGNRTSC